MQKISKISKVVLVLVLSFAILALSACGGNDEKSAAKDAESKASSKGSTASSSAVMSTSVASKNFTFPSDAELSKYTFLVYLNGSDLESRAGAATKDIMEMIEVGSTDEVNVIIQTGGTQKWQNSLVDSTKIERWKAVQGNIEKLDTQENANMGDPQTLYEFIGWGMTSFPAEKYVLVCWNHGAGAINGYAVDELHNHDALFLNEIDVALSSAYQETGKEFEIIGFDACLMATLETAKIVSPYAKYLVASEELEPGHGWNYTPIVQAMVDNPSITGDKLGKIIADSFKKQAQKSGTDKSITLSVVDLAEIDYVVEAADALVTSMGEDIVDEEDFITMVKARLNSEAYGDCGAHGGVTDMVDLADFARWISNGYPDEAENVIAAVDNAVVYKINSAAKPDAKGLSIYFPAKDKKSFDWNWYIYKDLKYSSTYKRFVNAQMVSLLEVSQGVGFDSQPSQNGVTRGANQSKKEVKASEISGNDNYFSISVKPADVPKLSEVYMVIGRYTDNTYKKIHILGRDSTVEIDEKTGKIKAEVDDAWEMLNGHFVTLDLIEEEDEYALFAIPAILNDVEVSIMVLYDDEYPEGFIMGARKINDDDDEIKAPDKNLIKIKKGDKITTLMEYELEKDDGKEEYGYEKGDSFVVGDKLEFKAKALPEGEYVYGFEIVDIYQNETYSDYVEYEYD